jgi:hypothetical protein
MKATTLKMWAMGLRIVLLLVVISGLCGCVTTGTMGTGSTAGADGPAPPSYQFRELQSDLQPVYLKSLDRAGISFIIRGSDAVVANTITDVLRSKGMTPAISAAEATFVIETRPGFVGAFKDYQNAPRFANDLGVVAATATHTGLLASHATGCGKAAAAADLAGAFITLMAKAAEHANTPNVFLGEINFKITEKLVTEKVATDDSSSKKSRKHPKHDLSVEVFEREGMFRTSVSGVGLQANLGLPTLSTHMGELVAGIF